MLLPVKNVPTRPTAALRSPIVLMKDDGANSEDATVDKDRMKARQSRSKERDGLAAKRPRSGSLILKAEAKVTPTRRASALMSM